MNRKRDDTVSQIFHSLNGKNHVGNLTITPKKKSLISHSLAVVDISYSKEPLCDKLASGGVKNDIKNLPLCIDKKKRKFILRRHKFSERRKKKYNL
jgi:hypothetical protein